MFVILFPTFVYTPYWYNRNIQFYTWTSSLHKHRVERLKYIPLHSTRHVPSSWQTQNVSKANPSIKFVTFIANLTYAESSNVWQPVKCTCKTNYPFHDKTSPQSTRKVTLKHAQFAVARKVSITLWAPFAHHVYHPDRHSAAYGLGRHCCKLPFCGLQTKMC